MGVFKYRIGTFNGIANFMMTMLTAVDIECYKIMYTKDEKRSQEYMINIAIVDNKAIIMDLAAESICSPIMKDKDLKLDLDIKKFEYYDISLDVASLDKKFLN